MESNYMQDKVRELDLENQKLKSEIQGAINDCAFYESGIKELTSVADPLKDVIARQFESIKLRLTRTQ